jgi:Domain of unknown function (DUF4160)
VYANDHSPHHVHIKLRSHPGAKLRINLGTAEFLDYVPRGVDSKRLRSFQAAVRKNHDVLAGWWENHHGMPSVDLDNTNCCGAPRSAPSASSGR